MSLSGFEVLYGMETNDSFVPAPFKDSGELKNSVQDMLMQEPLFTQSDRSFDAECNHTSNVSQQVAVVA